MTARASILNVNLMLLALLKPCTGCPLLCPQHLKPSLSALLLLSKTCSPILWLTHSPAPLALATLISQLADQGLNICFLNLEDFPPLLAYSCSTLAPPPPHRPPSQHHCLRESCSDSPASQRPLPYGPRDLGPHFSTNHAVMSTGCVTVGDPGCAVSGRSPPAWSSL